MKNSFESTFACPDSRRMKSARFKRQGRATLLDHRLQVSSVTGGSDHFQPALVARIRRVSTTSSRIRLSAAPA